MKKYKKIIIVIGVICLLCTLVSVWYANTYNDGRIVKLMDYSTYVFTPKDLPMIISLSATILYLLFLTICLLYNVIKNEKNKLTRLRTQMSNPKLGFFGFFGFLGFAGFWTYGLDKQIFPFVFFSFFGFFGNFFEGKMSNTLRDERFKENENKATLVAYRVGFSAIWLSLLLLSRGKRFFENLEYVAIVYTIVISLIIAFTMILNKYLLYHYDQKEQSGE